MSTIFAITVFVALVSYNVTKTSLLRPVRVALARRTPRRLRQVWRCHYCLSHHVAWATLLAAGWYYPFGTRLDPLLTWAAVVVLAGPVMTGIDWAIEAMDSFQRVFRTDEAPREPVYRAYPSSDGHREVVLRGGDRRKRLHPAGEMPPSN